MMAEEIENTQGTTENIAGREETGGPEENAEEEIKDENIGGAGNLLSPEGVVMLSVAVTIDLISLIPVVNIVSDIIGMIIIGSWMFFRSGTAPGRPQRPGKPKIPAKGGGKILRRFITVGIIEAIPIVSILPWWTITVYNELKG